MEELKPCPFCGSTGLFVGTLAEAEGHDESNPYYRFSSQYYTVVCDYTVGGCGASMGGGCRSVSRAIEAWNRRTEDGRT